MPPLLLVVGSFSSGSYGFLTLFDGTGPVGFIVRIICVVPEISWPPHWSQPIANVSTARIFDISDRSFARVSFLYGTLGRTDCTLDLCGESDFGRSHPASTVLASQADDALRCE